MYDIIYFWSIYLIQEQTKTEIAIKSNQTVFSWYKNLKRLTFSILKKRTKIGGAGQVVQIDECLFSKRKYNVGRYTRNIWIVGGISYQNNKVFLF